MDKELWLLVLCADVRLLIRIILDNFFVIGEVKSHSKAIKKPPTPDETRRGWICLIFIAYVPSVRFQSRLAVVFVVCVTLSDVPVIIGHTYM